MTPDTELYYAIAVRRPNAEPASAPDAVAAHHDAQQTRFPAGVVEVYASEAARDAAIGPVGAGVEFVACDAGEAGSEGAPELAVGPIVGEQEFETVLAVVADRLAPSLAHPGPHRVIVNRVAYAVDGDGRPLRPHALIPGSPSEAITVATSCAIWRALGERLPREQPEETSRANRATSRRKNARA